MYIIVKRICISIFSKIVSRSVKTVHTNLLAKNCKLQLEFRNVTPSGHALPLTDIQADFEINQHIRYQITAKINYFYRRQTDRRTDRNATLEPIPIRQVHFSGRAYLPSTIGSFFQQQKNSKKYINLLNNPYTRLCWKKTNVIAICKSRSTQLTIICKYIFVFTV